MYKCRHGSGFVPSLFLVCIDERLSFFTTSTNTHLRNLLLLPPHPPRLAGISFCVRMSPILRGPRAWPTKFGNLFSPRRLRSSKSRMGTESKTWQAQSRRYRSRCVRCILEPQGDEITIFSIAFVSVHVCVWARGIMVSFGQARMTQPNPDRLWRDGGKACLRRLAPVVV